MKPKGNEEIKRFLKAQKHYERIKPSIHAIYKKRKNLKVAFVVLFESVFPCRPVFEEMIKDGCFDPYIVVVPHVQRTMKYQQDLYRETYAKLYDEYPSRVIGGYDIEKDEYLELGEEYQIIFFCNPYKYLVHPFHNVEYFLDKKVLPIYSSYGFAALKFWEEVIATDFYNYMWKCTIETEGNRKHLETVEKIKGKNGLVTGYIKMDKMAQITPSANKTRKRIIICPHHTVWGWKNLNISNFLKYAEFFVELPKMFPEIDFIFRPHPLLVSNLLAHRVWTGKQVDNYFERLLANPNMTYDTAGEYFQQFVDSDAMIHDCGSFIGEYLYTEKPCCYMMKSKEETYKGLVPLGQQCMDQYYHAYEKEDIINFIQNVVLGGDDPMKEQRQAFVANELKVNYPNATKTLLNYIKKELRMPNDKAK